MDWIDAVSKAVTDGKTKSQFAVPDGVYAGDLYFITDKENKIIICLGWDGKEWHHGYETFDVERDDSREGISGFRPIKIIRKKGNNEKRK